ncbi:c-type cytochrome biogenesis protein CcmI [Marinobacter sp. CHS3-4]|uniref:c-type cytochrome biogenesis protein CcmI n=1 Tax=Marinobacter sp. CHS3-4 TaxID=3045174 RepID=UPI0024B62F1C|nr:c-type cytochrome biogenesis protein CcmI [Marinobacter sp. CHS3-4]MDI9245870.1 c-type cytochrome biogenesis protein CcmI [Marinobacter sp. CHS3-4]
MTQTFWLIASVLILLALAFVVAPLIFHRSGRRAALDVRNQNLLAYRSRLEELDRELDSGALDQESYQQLRDELAGSLMDDVPDAEKGILDSPAKVKGGRSALAIVLACLITIPAAAVYFYDQWGAMDEMEQFIAMQEMVATEGGRMGKMEDLAQQLREKLEQKPGNAEGWGLLGRTYMNLQQYSEAAWAFEKLAATIEDNPQRKATAWGLAAQALFFEHDGDMFAGAGKAIEKARAINPDEVNSLGLLGIASFRQQNFEDALKYWERIVQVAPDHPQIGSIRQGIEQAYQRLGQEPPAPQASEQSLAGGSPGVTVRVEIDPAFEADIADATPLFVFARPAGATGGTPLAVARLTAGQLPAVIRLDDRNAMSPQAKISDADSVRVQARLSRSGNALPQAGDWQGAVAEPIQVRAGETDPVILTIDTQLTQ